MSTSSFKSLCISHILEGLWEGLTHFSGPSRAAVLFAERPEDPIRVCDPQGLLAGHEPRLKELYLDTNQWRIGPDARDIKLFGHFFPERNLDLAGLISYGGRTSSIFYQMWFTEHHPDMCSVGPTERWLEWAVCLLAHDFATEHAFHTGTSRYVLREYATHAVRDYIRDRLDLLFGWDVQIEVYPILDAILAISKTREEGASPRGTLIFTDRGALAEPEFMVRFPPSQRPSLRNFKHIAKLLPAVANSERKLISDGKNILGITSGHPLPRCRIGADFLGEHGFVEFAGELICSFSDGSFHSTTRKPKLVQLEEALIGCPIDSALGTDLFKIVSGIVHQAGKSCHGCSIVVDLNDPPISIPGQELEWPIDLRDKAMLELAKSFAKVDGALHIGPDLRLYRFACLLDGRSVPGEDRSRGARFNSALRFTAERKNLIVIVVSADRPVSVFQDGVELTAQCDWKPLSDFLSLPPTLEEWIAASK